MRPDEYISLTPAEFEQYAKDFLERLARSSGGSLQDFKTEHLEGLSAHDGDYKIDVTARFTALNLDFLLLGECKHLKRPVERDEVMVLWAKKQSIEAHKCVMFSVSGYQKGAIEYALAHKIALIDFRDGQESYITRSVTPIYRPDLPKISIWRIGFSEEKNISYSSLNDGRMEPVQDFLTSERIGV